ncbi:respiratory nitrate reductase subunit gamma [Microbispora rosea]
MHVWSAPLAYLWRPYVVYRARRGPLPAVPPTPVAGREATARLGR